MARIKEEHYRYAYLSDLTTEYRKAAIESGTRKGTVAAMWQPVKGVSFVVNSTNNMLDSFDRFSRDANDATRKNIEREANRNKTAQSSTESTTTSGCDANQGPEKQTFKTLLRDVGDSSRNASLDYTITPGNDGPLQQLLGKNPDNILGLDEDILRYLQECWDCDLKIQFDWQLKPLNLLIGLEGFLDDIEDLIDMINDMLDPAKFLANFCDFFDGFSWICPPDLVALLLALAMLIKKYMMLAININLDWTALLGPLIKWIIDAIASFLQQIVQIIVAPLDCVIGALQSIQSVIDAADELGDTAISAASYLSSGMGMFDGETNPTSSITASKGNDRWQSYYDEEKERESIPKQFKSVNEEIKKNPNASFEDTDFAAKTDAIKETQRDGFQTLGFGLARKVVDDSANFQKNIEKNKFNIPTGINIGVNDTFDSFFAKRKKDKEQGKAVFDLSKISVFKTSILAVQTARQYIVDFFNQILFALTSLNAMFNAKLSLNVESLGLILLIIDLIKLIKMLIELKHANCQNLKDNPELVLRALERQYPNMTFELTDNGTIERTDSDLYTIKVPLDSCDTNRTSEEVSRSRKLKESVQKISGLKLR